MLIRVVCGRYVVLDVLIALYGNNKIVLLEGIVWVYWLIWK